MKTPGIALYLAMLATMLSCASCGKVASATSADPGQKATNTLSLAIKEVSLGKVPRDSDLDHVIVSPDGKRVTYSTQRFLGVHLYVATDGEEGKEYDGIGNGTPRFTPNSKHVVYAALHGDKEFLVIDKDEGSAYDALVEDSLAFSADGEHIAYAAERGGKQFVVLDRREGKKYDGLRDMGISLSPDGKRVAYQARRGNNWFMVVDDKEQQVSKTIFEGQRPVFSPDSRHVIYLTGSGERISVFLDGTAKEYDSVGLGDPDTFRFRPDSNRVAYVAKRGDKWYVVIRTITGQEVFSQAFDGVTVPIFSSDGKRIVYVQRGGKVRVVINEVAGLEYEGIIQGGGPFLSPDGQRVAFIAARNGKQFVVVDDKEGKEYEAVAPPLHFSPDSRHFIYGARRNGKWVVVVDGVEGKEYDGIRAHMTFSPDSRRTAYVAKRDNKNFVVVDGQEIRELDGNLVGTPVFSPDSTHVAYGARRGERWSVVVDGVEGKDYDGFPPGSKIIFTADHSFYVVTRRQTELLRVEVEIVEK